MKQRNLGFTIVEILVVVSVIGILVGIVAFSYGAWRTKAANTEVNDEVTNGAAAVKKYAAFNNVFPPDQSTFNTVYKAGSAVTLTYVRRADGLSFCLNGVSTVDNSVKWSVDSSVNYQPVTGACSPNSLTPPTNTTNMVLNVASSASINMAYYTTINLSATVSSTPTSLQWQMLTPKNTDTGTWVDLSGQTSLNMSYPYYQNGTSLFNQGDYGYFRIKATNSSGTAYSNAIYTTFVYNGD